MRKPHADGYMRSGLKRDHVKVAEKAMRKPLPSGSEVHHFNGIRADNTPSNLVVCPNRGYHMLLHMRQKALAACGDANKRKCTYCKQWDEVRNLKVRASKKQGDEYRHAKCHATYEMARKFRRNVDAPHFSMEHEGVK